MERLPRSDNDQLRGTWRPSTEARPLELVCPVCGLVLALTNYLIMSSGRVHHPSTVRCDRCEWEDQVELIGWNKEALEGPHV